MRIGYLILVHKNPPQLKRLINSLWNSKCLFFVHVDAQYNRNLFIEIFGAEMLRRIFFIDQITTPWGGFGLVKATLNGISKIVTQNKVDYIVLLSGQDYPIKNSQIISNYLEENFDRIFISHSPIPRKEWYMGGINRFPEYSTISKKIKLYGGSQWWAMPKSYAKRLLEFYNLMMDLRSILDT